MAKLLPSHPPFDGWTVYGPYMGRKGGSVRRMVTLRSPERTTTMTYARYLLCVRESRWLDRNEEADHVDEDPLNDDPANLQILTPAENKAKRKTAGRTMVTLLCPQCEVEFTRPRNLTHLVKGGKIPTCCSRSCSGKYQHALGV